MNGGQGRMFDFIIVGAGISGSFIAHELCQAGASCLMLEAGKHFTRQTYPETELDGTAQLYWAGGLELGPDCKIAFLRPKVVGGGSIVNQALVDRLDDFALDSWRDVSGVDYFSVPGMEQWYDRAESEICIQFIPAEHRNRNAEIFEQGFERLGYRLAPLRRAQKDCRYEDGNCCIECLNGCRIGSKQSTPETVLKKALEAGLTLMHEFEVETVSADGDGVEVEGIDRIGSRSAFQAKNLVLAAGAVGNSRLLLNSGLGKKLPNIGRNFYCHPQYDSFGVYDDQVNSHLGPFQAFKSEDPTFRRNGFKLENVYAGASAVAMLIGGFGRKHHHNMERLSHFACIEVSVQDTNPGRITVNRKGKPVIRKTLNSEDRERRRRGMETIREIFRVTGAGEVIEGRYGIGLHLMGGCGLGADPARSVVDPEFRLHGFKNVYAADSSVFPIAPGINPSLTVMALSKKAASEILRSG